MWCLTTWCLVKMINTPLRFEFFMLQRASPSLFYVYWMPVLCACMRMTHSCSQVIHNAIEAARNRRIHFLRIIHSVSTKGRHSFRCCNVPDRIRSTKWRIRIFYSWHQWLHQLRIVSHRRRLFKETIPRHKEEWEIKNRWCWVRCEQTYRKNSRACTRKSHSHRSWGSGEYTLVQ